MCESGERAAEHTHAALLAAMLAAGEAGQSRTAAQTPPMRVCPLAIQSSAMQRTKLGTAARHSQTPTHLLPRQRHCWDRRLCILPSSAFVLGVQLLFRLLLGRDAQLHYYCSPMQGWEDDAAVAGVLETTHRSAENAVHQIFTETALAVRLMSGV